MKLLLDENLSRRIVPSILSRYPGSWQVALLGLERASDAALWAYARQMLLDRRESLKSALIAANAACVDLY
jgi:predicted nuclease of predicted toxin-antitoxin system